MGLDRKESGEIGRATGVLAASTLLSRVLGLVRNQVLSHFFGAGFVADAFIAAFTIPNALRRLFGEGALTPAFVSLFTRQLRDQKPGPEAQNFMNSSFNWMSWIIGGICCVGILISPALVLLYVPEFRDTPGKFELSVELTRLLFPFLLLISWAALFMGALNSLKKFAIPALGPAVLNLCVLLIAPALLTFGDFSPRQGIFIFAGSILIGALAQVLIQLPTLAKESCLPKFRLPKRDPQVKELAWLLVPSVFGMAIYQINIIINRVFASSIPGAVSQLFYADLLIELPVSLIATSMSVAAVPSFTRLVVSKDRSALGQTFHFSYALNVSLALPAMAGIFLLASPLISSIFYSGKFSALDWQITTQCLLAYALGLPFFCLMRSLLPLFYANKDTRTPAYVGAFALLVNFVSAWWLSKKFGAPGIGLATTISSFANFSVLQYLVWRKYRDFPWAKIIISILKAISASLVMATALYGIQHFVSFKPWGEAGLNFNKISYLLGLVGFGIFIYFVAANWMKIEAVQILKRKLFKSRSN